MNKNIFRQQIKTMKKIVEPLIAMVQEDKNVNDIFGTRYGDMGVYGQSGDRVS